MWILFVLAVLPAIVLMAYIWFKDKTEKEPIGLVIGLFVLGALMVIPAGFGEIGLGEVLNRVFKEGSYAYMLTENFLIVALLEELCKFAVLRLRTWRNPNFNYTFDAVVYSVAVSLGFATLENIMYVVGNGTIDVAILRGVLSVPGHAIDGVFMGWFYGLAKRAECAGDPHGKSANIRRALTVPILIHGFYDFCLTVGEDLFILAFIVFEIVITIVAIRKIRELSRNDAPLLPIGTPFGQYVRSGMQQYQQPYIYQQYGAQQQYYGYGQPYQGDPNQYQQYGAQQQYYGNGQPYQGDPNQYQQYGAQQQYNGYSQPYQGGPNQYQQYGTQQQYNGYGQPYQGDPNQYQQYGTQQQYNGNGQPYQGGPNQPLQYGYDPNNGNSGQQ